jgi:hypothetical protein
LLDCALIPLIFGMFLFDGLRWRFSMMDILVLVFILSTGYTDHATGKSTQAIFTWFSSIIEHLGCYMAGKLLIEQTGFREKVVRKFVLLIAVSSILSSYEYFFRHNPYSSLFNHFYPSQWAPFTTQIRWGFGRMAGPYGQSEIAGIMIMTGWMFALWIGRPNYEEKANNIRPAIDRGKLLIWGTFLALFMTQARGPWIGAGIGLCFANIGRAKRRLPRTAVVMILIFAVGLPVYTFGKDYIAGPRKDYGSEKETAQYRAQLLANYVPVAQKGGAWGWGLDFPTMGGQDSIDNEYLLVWLNQGWIGLSVLILMLGGSFVQLIVQASRAGTVREAHFSISMIGIFVAIAFTISTVFLGGQTPALLFLLIGWTQAIRSPSHALQPARSRKAYRPATHARLAGTVTYT